MNQIAIIGAGLSGRLLALNLLGQVSRVRMRSTHRGGEFQGVPPTGKVIETASISIEQFKDGKITARRVYSDWLGMMQQLGVVPAQVK